MKTIKFGYFSEAETDQYNFYRVPKALFTEEYFKPLSCEAKILYGLMRDRMGLSIKNQWFDSQGRAYIIFTVADVMNILGCQSQKAVRLMKELDTSNGIGLIEKKRMGLGRPNIIYVKNFMVREDGSGHKTDAPRNDFSENCPSASCCKDHSGMENDVCESQYSCLDADALYPTEKVVAVTDVLEMEETIETNWPIESGEIPKMVGCMERNAAQNQEIGETLETGWWMGDAEILEMTGGPEDDAVQDETNWWMSETQAVDEAFDNQKSAMTEYLFEISGIGMKRGEQKDMVSETDYEDNEDNVDKWQEEGRAETENQITAKMMEPLFGGISGTERESAAGAGKNDIGTVGCMSKSASVLPNTRVQDAKERTVCNSGNSGFRDKEVEAMWHSVFERQMEGDCCESTKLLGDAGQELSKMNFQCGEIQDSGLVSGRTAEFWNAKCNDTDTSDTEYVSKTENSENKDSKTDFCKSHPSYQSDPSYPVCLPEKKEACCAENGETDGLGTKGMAGQLSGNRGNVSVKDRMDSYRETIRDNISYSCFQNGRGIEDVDELVELMVDTMMVPDGCTMRIAGMDKPASVVKECFMKLAHSHIEYVMDCLQKHTGKIWNIKAYLLTSLYNSALTISNYYRAEVNHDLYGCYGC